MVTLLSSAGNPDAVIALESLWHTLTHGLPFITRCAYQNSCFHEGVPNLWPRVCTEHWALSHTSDL